MANVTELFERLAYYAQAAVLAIFLHESLHLSTEQTGTLMGVFGFAVWFLPILGGSLADRFGFRRSLAFAYLTLAVGYFLMGSLSAPWMAPLRERLPLFWVVLIVLMVPALGPSIVKPSLPERRRAPPASPSDPSDIRSTTRWSILAGCSAPSPLFSCGARSGIENVFRVSALCVFAMFFATLIFYREPTRAGESNVPTVAAALRNMFVVFANLPFLAFLLIFSGFWIVFWQQFIALPLFLRGYVDPNAKIDLLLSVDPATVIAFQIVVSYLTRRIPAFRAMTLGILISSFSWLILLLHASTGFVIASLFILALGEIIAIASLL